MSRPGILIALIVRITTAQEKRFPAEAFFEDPFALIQTRFLRTAQTAAWVRSLTPILRKMCWTCSLTVS